MIYLNAESLMYEVRNISKSYGQTIAVRNISVDLPPNVIITILGPSGSGKTTLLRLLSFLESPDSGTVTLRTNGLTYNSAENPTPWPNVTCVFQRQFLWPHLTLRENIELPLRSRHHREVAQTMKQVIELFDMASFINRYPNEVSGGQAQRVALARAFALNPQIILLDEAHANLDLDQKAVLNSHLVLLRQTGTSLVVVTHSLDFAIHHADLVLVMDNGAMVEFGSRDILSHPQSAFLKRATEH